MKTPITRSAGEPGPAVESANKKIPQNTPRDSEVQKRKAGSQVIDFDQISPGSSRMVSISKQAFDEPQKLVIARPQKRRRSADEDLSNIVNTGDARRFWRVGRPYFFAVEKHESRPAQTVSLAHLQAILEEHDDYFDPIDKGYYIYFIKPTETSKVKRLTNIKSLASLGVPETALESLWSLDDDDQSDPDNIWLYASRVTLFLLFKYENDAIECDKGYAEFIIKDMSENQRQCALSGLLYLAAHKNCTAFLDMLIKEKADVNADAGLYGNQTALGVAIERENLAVAEVLLKAGARPDYSPDGITKSGLDAARALQSKEAFDLLDRYT